MNMLFKFSNSMLPCISGAVDRLESSLGMLPADAINASAEIDTPVATDEVVRTAKLRSMGQRTLQ